MVSKADKNGNIEVSIKVKNTGNVPGKDVVQIYVNAPYTEYDIANNIEKASVSLVGFDKTKLLKPNESETINITLNLKDFMEEA